MRWAYDDNTRDLFGKGIHRDILIVPHATFVTPVPGGPPEITSKVPKYVWVPMPVPVWDETEKKIKIVTMQKPFPERDGQGNVVREDVEWVITNDDIVKEKFKYSNSLNSDDNLTFSSCNAAMVQFTIRNKKEYIEELDDEDEPTGNYYWEQEVPNLQKYEKVIKDPNGTTRKIVGELMSNACIKVYMYFNGDSSTLMYLGMFKVEEDKTIDNGYNRQITAYDFLAWFREIDIFYWYKHLFEGINKLGNDYEDYTSDKTSKEKHTQAEWDANYIRDPKEKWTIGEALNDLIDHFAAYDMTVFEEEVINEETGDKAKVMKLGTTSTNQNEYGRDNYEEDNGYTGLGMPILLDPNVMTKGAKAHMPTEPGPDEKEEYGYMDILDLEFYANPAIMKTESLSAGKFLEDIGLLAGRYPYIRTDDLVDDDWIDPLTITPTEQEPHPSRYNTYEKCILTFKPLPSVKDDKKIENIPESVFDNHDIVKGFQHDYYQTQDITVMKFELDDGTEIKYSKLAKDQLVAEQKSELQTFTITNNMFANYLVTKSDDDNVKKMLDKYKVIREKLFGKNSTAGNMSPDALFNQGYNNIRNRIYTPYQLTTFADPVRDVGDRIKIDFTDMLTGEQSHFYTYILERSMEGIQKCMDTYTAKGSMKNPLFTNYQTSSKAKSGGDTGQTSEDLDIMTPFDLIEYMRNCGYRMLDEPSDCEAKFAKGTDGEIDLSKNHLYVTSSYPQETYIKDGDTTNPITVGGQQINIIEGDYVLVKNYQRDDPIVPEYGESAWWYINWPLYVYTANNTWKYVGDNGWGMTDIYDMSAWSPEEVDIFIDHEDNYPIVTYEQGWGTPLTDEINGMTNNKIVLRPKEPLNKFPYEVSNNGLWTIYGATTEETGFITETITREAQFGTYANLYTLAKFQNNNTSAYDRDKAYIYQYPGFWNNVEHGYPDLESTIADSSKPYVQLKWSDPPDIDTWEPYPCAWEGTVIVRKEDSAPLHRWDGEKVVLNKTRDKYKTKGYKDEDIKMGRTYYYGFFPYYTADDSDPEHPIRYYTFTKVIKVETGDNSIASSIDSIDVNGNTATIKYTLEQPDSATFASIKIYGKIGSNPSCDDTDDVVKDIDDGSSSKDISGLEYDSVYYFCLVTVDSNDEELSSNIEIAQIEADPGPQPDPQYVEYINLINGNNNLYKYYMTDNWMQLYDGLTRGFYYFNDEGKKYTYVISNGSRRSIRHWNNSNYWSNYIAYYNGNYYSTYKCYALDIIDININGDNDSYTITTSLLNPNPNFINNRFGENIPCYAGTLQYYYNNNTWSFGVSTDTTSKPTVEDITYTGTLEDCFKYLAMNVRNANIYVNGVLWALSANND